MGVPLLGVAPQIADLDRPLVINNGAVRPVTPHSRYAYCPPSYKRCSLNAIPQTYSLLSKSRVPLGLMINPFKIPTGDEVL